MPKSGRKILRYRKKNNNENRLLVKLVLQEVRAPKVRGHSAEENLVLT